MPTNWKKIYAMKKVGESRIKKLCPDIENKSGIYVWYRPYYKFYAGQSIKLLDRSIQHLTQYDHLGLSIKKHGLYDKVKNPYGWKMIYYYCDVSVLNEEERKTIENWAKNGEPYNITSGGQDSGKYDINKRQESKGYRQGVEYGYKNAIRDVKEYFDKYLDFNYKRPQCYKKNNEIKEIFIKKFTDFKELLEGDDKNE